MPDRSLSRFLQNVPRFKLVQANLHWMKSKTFRIHRKYLDTDDYFCTVSAASVYPFRISGVPRFVCVKDSHANSNRDPCINIYASAPVTDFDSDTTLIILNYAGTCIKTTARDPFRVVWRCLSIGSSFQDFETLFQTIEDLVNRLYPIDPIAKSEIIKKEIKMPTKPPVKKIVTKAPAKPVVAKPEAPKPAAPVTYCWVLRGLSCFADDMRGPFKTAEAAKKDALKEHVKKNPGRKIEIREIDQPDLAAYTQSAFKGYDTDNLLDLITNRMFNSLKSTFSDNSYIHILEFHEAKANKELISLLSDWAVKYVKYDGLQAGKKLIESFDIPGGKKK
jgi:hypothetical protein